MTILSSSCFIAPNHPPILEGRKVDDWARWEASSESFMKCCPSASVKTSGFISILPAWINQSNGLAFNFDCSYAKSNWLQVSPGRKEFLIHFLIPWSPDAATNPNGNYSLKGRHLNNLIKILFFYIITRSRSKTQAFYILKVNSFLLTYPTTQ